MKVLYIMHPNVRNLVKTYILIPVSQVLDHQVEYSIQKILIKKVIRHFIYWVFLYVSFSSL